MIIANQYIALRVAIFDIKFKYMYKILKEG